MENKIERVMQVIERDGLICNSRYRSYLDKRSFIYAMLHKDGFSLVEIGKIFKKNHATIINGIKKHNDYKQIKDELYEYNVREYKAMFYEPKRKNVDVIEKDENLYNGTQLIQDILECKNTTDLLIIKNKILNEEYFLNKATIVE